jgi:chromosome segregation ATPase/predicted RNA-binding Zn-ribbon protein involved in translation (DUF1610 family)
MKTFIVASAQIEQFKCFSGLVKVEFGEKSTSISGDNETGKSSLADSIAYCLTGKTSEGESTFTIVPIGAEKEGISPSVTLECVIKEDGKPDKPVTLTRTYKAAYNRERVFTGEYATECAINGTPCTVKAFDQWIETNICKQDVYKLLTTVRYFTEGIQSKAGKSDWQQRRELLLGLIDESALPSDYALATEHKQQFSDLVEQLPRYETAAAYLDFLKRKEAELIKRIADFPIKVNQQQSNMRNLTETVAPDFVEKKIVECTDAIKALEEENKAFKQKRRESATAKKLQKLQELNQQRTEVLNDFRATESAWQSKVRELDGKILESKRIIENLERTIQLKTNDALISYQTEVNDTCAACSQKLPAETVEHVKAKKKESYEAALESIKALENDLAKEKEHLNELTKQIDLLPDKPTIDQTELDKIDSAIFTIQQEIAGFNVNADMPNYLDRFEAIEAERKKYGDISRTIQLNDECEAKIKELEQQNVLDSQAKSELQQKIDNVGEFIKLKCEIAQGAVQTHFVGTGLSFELFKFVKSTGEVKECCNILLNGTPYNDLSYSTKYIASLYIVEAFQKAYGVSLPIISDNTESIDYEGYAESATSNSQTILMFRVEENCPKCGGHSGRRSLDGKWTCQKCGNVWRKSVTINANNKH